MLVAGRAAQARFLEAAVLLTAISQRAHLAATSTCPQHQILSPHLSKNYLLQLCPVSNGIVASGRSAAVVPSPSCRQVSTRECLGVSRGITGACLFAALFCSCSMSLTIVARANVQAPGSISCQQSAVSSQQSAPVEPTRALVLYIYTLGSHQTEMRPITRALDQRVNMPYPRL